MSKNSAKINNNVNSDSVAVRAAKKFDSGKAAVANDWRKPMVKSTAKRTACVAGVMGVGFGLGAWLA